MGSGLKKGMVIKTAAIYLLIGTETFELDNMD